MESHLDLLMLKHLNFVKCIILGSYNGEVLVSTLGASNGITLGLDE